MTYKELETKIKLFLCGTNGRNLAYNLDKLIREILHASECPSCSKPRGRILTDGSSGPTIRDRKGITTTEMRETCDDFAFRLASPPNQVWDE